MRTYEDMAKEAEALRKAGKELDDLVPVRARVAKDVRAVFSLGLSPDELTEISVTAKERGQPIDDFIRLAALAAARGDFDLDSVALAAVLADLRAKALELAEAANRVSSSARRPPIQAKATRGSSGRRKSPSS